VPQHHVRARDLNLGEALQPALRQRHLLLDGAPGERRHPHLVVTDVHQHRLVVVHLRERRPHRRVEVDVRRSPLARPAVQDAGLQVEPRVDAGAGGERLEAQPVQVGRDDGIRGQDSRGDHVRRLVVARARDLGHDEQSLGRRRGSPRKPLKKYGFGTRPPEVANVTSARPSSSVTADGAR
jgi:hypothetical protein